MTVDVAQLQPDLLQFNPLLNFDKTQNQQFPLHHVNGDGPDKTIENDKQATSVEDETDKPLLGLDFLEGAADLFASESFTPTERTQLFITNVDILADEEREPELPESELVKLAMDILFDELGIVPATRFIQRFTNGRGDYTKERDKIVGNQTVADIAARIRQRKQVNENTIQHRIP